MLQFIHFKAENELATLARRVQQLEEELEKTEEKTRNVQVKLEQVSQAGDESERLRKMFEHRNQVDAERLKQLEAQLKEARNAVEEADKKYDEVSTIFPWI